MANALSGERLQKSQSLGALKTQVGAFPNAAFNRLIQGVLNLPWIHRMMEGEWKTRGQLRYARNTLMRSQGNKCCYCRSPIDHRFNLIPAEIHRLATLEHLTPVSRGGCDRDDNLAVSCMKCNNDKADMTDAEFRSVMTS